MESLYFYQPEPALIIALSSPRERYQFDPDAPEFIREYKGLVNQDVGVGVSWILDHLAEPAVGIAALKVAKDGLVAWLKRMDGRRVTISVAGKHAEVRGSADIEAAILALGKLPPSQIKRPRRKAKEFGASEEGAFWLGAEPDRSLPRHRRSQTRRSDPGA